MSEATLPFNLHDQAAPGWLDRAEVCADLVSERLSLLGRPARLADLGCGDAKLRHVLATRGLRVLYQGFDLLPQGEDVLPLDLTTDRPPNGFDIAVMLGVGEYLPDLAKVLSAIGNASSWLIFSHVLRRQPPISAQRLAELGWVNHLDSTAIEAVMSDAGLKILAQRLTPDRRTVVLVCTRAVTSA